MLLNTLNVVEDEALPASRVFKAVSPRCFLEDSVEKLMKDLKDS